MPSYGKKIQSEPPIDPASGSPLPQKYDPSQFNVSPADSKGVSYRVTFRAPPDMDNGLEIVLQSKRFPFSTKGDILRWCVHQGLKQLEKMEPIESVSKRIDILTTLLNEEQSHSEFMAVFNHLEEGVSRYMADQAPQQATRVVAMAKHQFSGMPEGHWRSRYLEELEKRFGFLLKKAGVGLVEMQQPKMESEPV